jgi:hypothetical protein
METLSDLTAEYVRSILRYNPESGLFCWLTGRYGGNLAGTVQKSGHIRINIAGKGYLTHRLAWLIMTGEWPVNDIDHRDINPGNNRWSNLRLADKTKNGLNRTKTSRNKSGLKGVAFHKASGKWSAAIGVNYKQKWLGLFDSPELAHAAYRNAAQELSPDFARVF